MLSLKQQFQELIGGLSVAFRQKRETTKLFFPFARVEQIVN